MPRARSIVLAIVCLLVVAAGPAAADFLLEKNLSFQPGDRFDLATDSGRVSVRGVDRRGVRVVVTSKDDDLTDRYDFSFEEVSGGVEVRVKKKGSFVKRWFHSGHSPRFEIELPRQAELELHTAGGRIEVHDIDGSARVHTSGGRIELEEISGTVRATTSGGSISAVNLGADARLDTSGGSISVDRVVGAVTADTSGGSISIRDAGGRIEADTSGGSVTAYFARGNDAGGSLSSSGGRITAYVDESAGLEIDASSSGGSVDVDLPITVRGKISRRSIRGTLNGGGPILEMHTSGGGVSLRPL